jgi:hypothetical protein
MGHRVVPMEDRVGWMGVWVGWMCNPVGWMRNPRGWIVDLVGWMANVVGWISDRMGRVNRLGPRIGRAMAVLACERGFYLDWALGTGDWAIEGRGPWGMGNGQWRRKAAQRKAAQSRQQPFAIRHQDGSVAKRHRPSMPLDASRCPSPSDACPLDPSIPCPSIPPPQAAPPFVAPSLRRFVAFPPPGPRHFCWPPRGPTDTLPCKETLSSPSGLTI